MVTEADTQTMERRVRDVLTHPSGRTAIATALGYAIILAVMTVLLFGGGWLAFAVFG